MGWKDILRPIRDRLRDNLPDWHSDGPEQTDMVGEFAYFETFEELDRDVAIDPLHCANTPLLQRAKLPADDVCRTSITMIHDFRGGYHAFEGPQGNRLFADDYIWSFAYMQLIDRFVYFSHKLITIPPAAWTNALHRNGVRSLGTFIVEPAARGMERILDHEGATFHLAARLAKIAADYGFDGWLIDIEKTFPVLVYKRPLLVGFLEQLKHEMGEGNVVWSVIRRQRDPQLTSCRYDALTSANTVQYQNELTALNAPFAQAAGAILTNYAWTPEKAQSSLKVAQDHAVKPENVIVGIDVWAQNSDDPRRVTWPRNVGGGTGTGMAVRKLAETGVSAGIFAPAWAYEHYATKAEQFKPTTSDKIELAMWIGEKMPEVECPCGTPNPHDIDNYQDNPILNSAKTYIAGSEDFFYTNFCQPLQTFDNKSSLIASQSVYPKLTSNGPLTAGMGYYPSALDIAYRHSKDTTGAVLLHLKTFDLHMPDPSSLYVAIKVYGEMNEEPGFDLSIELEGTDRFISLNGEDYPEPCLLTDLPKRHEGNGDALTGLVVRISGSNHPEDALINITLLSIGVYRVPQTWTEPTQSITETWLQRHGEQTRLHWRYEYETDPNDKNAFHPRGRLMGPFSHFNVRLHDCSGLHIYASECILDHYTMNSIRKSPDAMVKIEGVGFVGQTLATLEVRAKDLRSV